MEKVDKLDKKILGILSTYARDNEQLMDLLNNKLQTIPGVVSTETLISLEQSIKREITIQPDEV